MRRASLALAVWLAAAHAYAQVTVDGCPSELGEATSAALDVELSSASESTRRALADGTLRCAIRCEGSDVVASVMRGDAGIEQRITREGPGAPRRVAIALAELLEASSATTTPEAAPPPPPPPPPTAPPADPLHVRLRAFAGAWLGGEPLLGLGTLHLGAEIAPTSNVAIVVDASGALGAVGVADARLDVRLLSLGVSLRFGGDLGPFWLGGGPAARGGAVSWTGTPTDPSRGVGRDAMGGWLGLGAAAAALVRIEGSPVRLGLEIEGGGIAIYSGALVLGALAQRIGGGWVELGLVVDVTLE